MAGLATALMLHLFDSDFSEAVFMKALLWILIGMILALSSKALASGADA